MAGKRGRARLYSPGTSRERRVQRARDRRERCIFIGESWQRWKSLKTEHGPCLSEAEWSSRLLDAFERTLPLSSTPLGCLSPVGLIEMEISDEKRKGESNDMDHNYSRKPGERNNFMIEVNATGEIDDSDAEYHCDDKFYDSQNEEDEGNDELNLSLIDPILIESSQDASVSEEVFDVDDTEEFQVEDLVIDPCPEETVQHISSADDISSTEECFMVYKSCLLDLAAIQVPTSCPMCEEKLELEVKKIGTGIFLEWKCEEGHKVHRWASQPVLPRGGMLGNINMASAIILSGNNYAKISLMTRFLNLAFLGKSSFYNYQSSYIVPGVNDYWVDTKTARFEQLRGQEVIVAGDGRMDSPGHCAKYCTYSVMEVHSKSLSDVVVVDKRETQLKSTTMEGLAFTRIIDGLINAGVIVKEIVTDAHPQISSIMKKKYPAILHSYDVWHGAKNLARKLCAAAAPRDCADLRPWIRDITNHFWYCARECNGDHEKFMARWIGVVHHVTGTHEWGLGKCEHEDVPDSEEDKKYLSPDSPAHLALREVLYSPYMLRTIPYYLRFRSTSDLESFQNHILMYASKRFAFSYDAYKARCQLAAIDYQAHLDRPEKKTADGQNIYHRIYSKITNHWRALTTKTDKGYVYIPELIANIISKCISGEVTTRSKRELPASHPSRIRATTSKISPQSTIAIVNQQKSRYK